MVEEKDLLYEKRFTCPACHNEFTSKVMKSGKARLLETDSDLRAKYDGIDSVKYDVQLCPMCGYAALSRYFDKLTAAQAKLVEEKVNAKMCVRQQPGDIYSYEQAAERYKMALICAAAKRAQASEKAYICLKSGWLVRGYKESLQEGGQGDEALFAKLAEQEEEYLQSAYKEFLEARQTESYPMCGMDEVTVDYLIASLAVRFGEHDMASRLLASVLTSPAAGARIKDKARDLKEELLARSK